MAGLKILGCGSAHGEKTVTNIDLEKLMDTSDEWIRSKTGIVSRYFAEELKNADMAEEAARKALKASGITADQIGILVVCTFTPDMATPSVSCGLAGRLGVKSSTLCFDLNGACSGFVYGCTTVAAMLNQGYARYALVVGSEKISPLLDMGDRSTAILFGDGAGAAVMTADDAKPFDCVWGCRPDESVLSCERFKPIVHMRGQEVYRFAVSTVPKNIKQLLDQNGLTADDIDLYVLHQANLRIINRIADFLKVSREKLYKNIQEYGNTSAASVAICLAELFEQNRLKNGMRIVISGFGAGLTYGSMLLTI